MYKKLNKITDLLLEHHPKTPVFVAQTQNQTSSIS
jgi:hypothetical protein